MKNKANKKNNIKDKIIAVVAYLVAILFIFFTSVLVAWIFPDLDIDLIILFGSCLLLISIFIIYYLFVFIIKRINLKKYGEEYIYLEELLVCRLGFDNNEFKESKKINKYLSYFIDDIDNNLAIFKNDIKEFDKFLEEICKEKGFPELYERYNEPLIKRIDE